LDFASRIGIDPAAKRAQQSHEGQRRIGLERVMDGVRVIGKRRVDLAVGLPDGPCAVHIDRSADSFDDGLHVDEVAEETCCRGLER
jgi:hypothetical protein